MKILITGGAGFIGSHIADAYIREGHSVVILDNLSSGRIANVHPDAKFVEGDIRDRDLIDRLFAEHRFDVVNHQAAQMDVRKSVDDPIFDAETNILGSLNLLQASKKYSVHRFILASTGGAIYGEQEYFPADELHPTNPESPYGVAKRTIEMYLHYFSVVHGIKYTAFRYSNVYGPRQDPHGEAGVVSIFSNALRSGKPCTIFGDGKQTRDYVFVADVVRAHIKALDLEAASDTYNLSTAIETTVSQLYALIAESLGKNSTEPRYSSARKGEVQRSVCSYQKAFHHFGWQPEVSLRYGLQRTLIYFEATLSA